MQRTIEANVHPTLVKVTPSVEYLVPQGEEEQPGERYFNGFDLLGLPSDVVERVASNGASHYTRVAQACGFTGIRMVECDEGLVFIATNRSTQAV